MKTIAENANDPNADANAAQEQDAADAKESHTAKFNIFEVTTDPDTQDVTVKRSSGPGSPVAFSMTYVFHADGTQEVSDRGTFTKNEQPAEPAPALSVRQHRN